MAEKMTQEQRLDTLVEAFKADSVEGPRQRIAFICVYVADRNVRQRGGICYYEGADCLLLDQRRCVVGLSGRLLR